MKKVLFSAIALLSFVRLLAQAPEGINYQAVARDVSGAEMPNTPVAVQVQILNSALAVIYQEDHLDTTNAFGLFNLVIGQGQNPTSSFANINWASGPFYLKIAIDANNSGLVNMGYTQLWSVPYALYAKESANGPQGLPGVNCWDTNGDGVNDPAEDRNGDSQWNALDCQGDSGLIGATGPQGATGPSGPQGIQGIQGVTGTQGVAGITGATGTNGIHCWDLNGNGVNEIGEDINSDGFWDANDCPGATGAAGANGIHCWDLNGNGVNEIGEDINSDGFWDANDCVGAAGVAGVNGLHCWDANGNGVNEIGEDINSDGFWDANDCIGATGPAGTQGPTGATGIAGTNGVTGATGPIGLTGPNGATGVTGNNGTNGATGATGVAGTNGATGPTGLTGANGATGANGTNGATGATGVAGTNGATGPTGLTGANGATGSNGINGATGATGPSGATGSNGATGSTGLAGATGSNGTNGATGATGPSGANGSNGATGPTGLAGATGSNGTNGATGPTGLAGTNGATGATGPSGTTGANGATGAMGPTGNNGTNGATGPTGPSWTLSTLTYSTTGALTLTGTAGSGGPITSTANAWLTTGNTGTNSGTNFIGTTDPVDLIFRTGNGNRMQINTSGNVGIGVVPSYRLHVVAPATDQTVGMFEGSNSGWTSIYLNGTGATSNVIFGYNRTGLLKAYEGINGVNDWFLSVGSFSNPLYVSSAQGYVGVNTNSPQANLHVNGSVRVSSLAGPGVVTTDILGNLSVASGSAVTGSGTANYSARWITPSTLGTGAITDWGSSAGIGIGAQSPSYTLSFPANSFIGVNPPTLSPMSGGDLTITAGDALGMNQSGGRLFFRGGQSTGTGGSSQIIFYISPNGASSSSSANGLISALNIGDDGRTVVSKNYSGNTSTRFWGETNSDIYAVLGTNNTTGGGTGVSGVSIATSGIAVGIMGSAQGGTSNYAGYFQQGQVYVQNNLGVGVLNPTTARLEVTEPVSFYTTFLQNTYNGLQDHYGSYSRSVNNPGYGYGSYAEGGFYGAYGNGNGTSYTGIVCGIYGTATGTAGTRYGVFGTATGGATNYGVYCQGNGAYTGTWLNVSDQKFKENVQPMSGSLSRIMQLRPVTYTMKKDEYPSMNFSDGTQVGFIAQEMEKVFPELVANGVDPGPINPETGRSDNPIEYKGINYIGLTPILVEAIQEQQVLIDSLQTQIDLLSGGSTSNGTVTTDANGYATVQLPAGYEAAHSGFQYQLTIMGADFAQAIVYQEISNNQFVIKTDKPGVKVSWQVSGQAK